MTQHMLIDSDPIRFPVAADGAALDATLLLPPDAQGAVIFAHSSGSSRLSPSNRALARQLGDAGLASLLVDLLTLDEEAATGQHRGADLGLLTRRLLAATDQLGTCPEMAGMSIGYLGFGEGAAAALLAAGERPASIGAVVSVYGRPELASPQLIAVLAPTLLIVGGEDHEGITRNEAALPFLPEDSALALIPGAGNRLRPGGDLEQMAQLVARWYARFLG